MKKYIHLFSLLFSLFVYEAKAQDYLSFYNLGDYVMQTQDLSPILLPKYKVNFGTPLNIGLNLNSEITINQFLVESGNNLKVDFDNLNIVAGETNIVTSDIVANIFILAFKVNKGSISIFANAKSNLAWQFSEDFTDIAANGFGQSFSLSKENIGFTSYSEIGIGYTRTFLGDKIAVGLRLKTLAGIAHTSLEENAQFGVDINSTNFIWTASATNATLNTSGISDTENLSLFGNNGGFAMDLGLNYKLNDKLSFELSINDLGSINWEDNVTNYNIEDVNGGVYNGFDFEDSVDILDEIEDALNNVIGTTETNESFKTNLSSRMFFSTKYKMSKKNVLRATYFKNNNPYIETKPRFGLGYNRELNKSTYGIIASAGGINGGLRFGANLAIQLGILQLYTAIDDVTNIGGKVQEANSANFRFGMNFLFGYNRKSTDSKIDEYKDVKNL
jgi:hypothetical protein